MKGQLRNPVLSGVLSAIVPGTGQIYNQDVIKGWIVLFLFLLLAGTLLGGLAVWVYGIVDAYLVAEKINRGVKRLKLERKLAYATASSLICGWGQIYNGQLIKGGLMMACFIFLAPTGIGLIFMWLYSGLDAYFTAEKINRGEMETPLIKGLIYHRLDSLHGLLQEEGRVLPPPVKSGSTGELKKNLLLALERGDYRVALNSGKLALESGDDPEIYSHMGKIYLTPGNYGFSTLEFIRALELGDRRAELYNNLGLSILNYIKSSKEKSYLYIAELCLEYAMEKGCIEGEINFINLLIIKGELEEAKRRCHSLLEKNPSLWQGEHSLGLILLTEGKRDKAKDIFLKILTKNPGAWESKICLGRICEEEQAEGQAISIYKELLNSSPPERIIKGITCRIKRLSSPERRLLRMVFGEKEVI